MNNQSPNSGFFEISLLHSQHYSSIKIRRVKNVLNTPAAEASCCFILISGLIEEAEMYDTNNKRSFDLSEYKKQRCLKFWKFAHLSKVYINRIKYSIKLTDPQVSVENMKLLIRWNRTIKQNFSAVNNVQKAVFWIFTFCIPSTIWVWTSGAWKWNWILLPQKNADVFLWWLEFLMKLKCTILTIFIWSGWIREIALFELLNICPHCFKFHIKLISYSIWLKDPQMPVQNLKLLMCWNKILETLRRSCRQQFLLKISVSLSACFWIYLQSSILKLIKF